MTVVSGQRRTDNIGSFQRKLDMHRDILELEPDEQALTVFLNNIYDGGRRIRCVNSEFNWAEHELEDRFDAVDNSGGYNSSATSIVVDTGDLFYAGALVKVPRTGEVMRVTSVSTNTLTVVRGYGATSGAAVNDNEPLFIISNAREEGTTSPTARTNNPVKKTNYTQIFKTSVEESGTGMSSDNETEPHDWRFQQMVKGKEHAKDKEFAFLFGSKGEENGTDGKIRVTGGVLEFATENNVDAGGSLTEVEFESFLRPFYRYGSKNKVLFVSPLVASVLSGFSQTKLQTSVGDTVYGVKIQRWISIHGETKIVKHDGFEGATYGGYAVGVDFEKGKAAYRYLHGRNAPGGSRDTHLNENIQANDMDGRKDQWESECGLQLAQPKVHGVLTGVTG